ncbi:uncharacterized protein LOC114716391 [Neltuma alba]|uniref:uncharacterized protein LOC114716391 n=1 Tax=Neltuma alba TaxID=207710 RepID=UPI0010A592BA|nr:uncharacterized protein LOC114716391 [Prosopis alba]
MWWAPCPIFLSKFLSTSGEIFTVSEHSPTALSRQACIGPHSFPRRTLSSSLVQWSQFVQAAASSSDFNSSLYDDSAIVKLDLVLFKSYADVHFMTASCRGFVFLKPINERKMSNHNKEGMIKDLEEEMLDFESEVKRFTNFEVATKGPDFKFNFNFNYNHVLQDWEWCRRMCIVQLRKHEESIHETIRRTEKCRDVIRMGPQAFMQLCAKLRNTGRVKDSKNVTVEEQVAKFLHTLAHNVRSRTMAFYFNRSRETISRHFHNVLQAIVSLEAEFLVQPSGSEVSPEILNNERFYPYFKDCIGAIDGTHVRAKVPKKEAARFRGRKDYPTQNVFAACSFDMKFTYVLAGWEGTASDSRILKNALSREDKIIIPQGKFYLGDAGFPLKRGVITPYRGVRYHLKEYSTRAPQNATEIFNHRHASLRNVIERTFGVLKKRFPIMAVAQSHIFQLRQWLIL